MNSTLITTSLCKNNNNKYKNFTQLNFVSQQQVLVLKTNFFKQKLITGCNCILSGL